MEDFQVYLAMFTKISLHYVITFFVDLGASRLFLGEYSHLRSSLTPFHSDRREICADYCDNA